MKNILILMGRYLPGYKDGGPVRTIVNLVDILGNEYNFNIMTSDRDHGDKNHMIILLLMIGMQLVKQMFIMLKMRNLN